MAMIKVDTSKFIPIYQQIKNQIKRQVGLSILKPNQMLPSIRDLATDLLVNPNTVARAYRELEMEGYIYTRKGKGCYVSALSAVTLEEERTIVINRIFDDAIEEGMKLQPSQEKLKQIFEERLDSVNKKKETTHNE
jgi:GntR family transcriptional regulator